MLLFSPPHHPLPHHTHPPAKRKEKIKAGRESLKWWARAEGNHGNHVSRWCVNACVFAHLFHAGKWTVRKHFKRPTKPGTNLIKFLIISQWHWLTWCWWADTKGSSAFELGFFLYVWFLVASIFPPAPCSMHTYTDVLFREFPEFWRRGSCYTTWNVPNRLLSDIITQTCTSATAGKRFYTIYRSWFYRCKSWHTW